MSAKTAQFLVAFVQHKGEVSATTLPRLRGGRLVEMVERHVTRCSAVRSLSEAEVVRDDRFA